MFRIIFKVLLAMLVFMNVFSQSRLYGEQQGFYIGKFVIALLLGAFLFFVITLRRETLRVSLPIKQISLAFAIWIFFMISSLFNSIYPLSGSLVLISYIILFLLVFILIPSNISNKSDYLQYNKIFVESALLSLILSIVLSINDPDSFYIIGDRIRYRAFFKNPNYLGIFLLLGILSSFQVYSISHQKKYLVVIFPLLFLLYITDSRTSMIATGVAALVIVYLYLRARSKNETKMLIDASAFTTIGILLVLGSIAVYFTPLEALNKFTSLRLLYWSQTIGSLANVEWFFGQGLGKEGLGSLSLDSYYVSILIQVGLLGLSAMIIFIMSVFCWLWKKLKQMPNDVSLQVTTACFMALVAYSFFESALFSLGNSLSIYVWMNVGCRVVKGRRVL